MAAATAAETEEEFVPGAGLIGLVISLCPKSDQRLSALVHFQYSAALFRNDAEVVRCFNQRMPCECNGVLFREGLWCQMNCVAAI